MTKKYALVLGLLIASASALADVPPANQAFQLRPGQSVSLIPMQAVTVSCEAGTGGVVTPPPLQVVTGLCSCGITGGSGAYTCYLNYDVVLSDGTSKRALVLESWYEYAQSDCNTECAKKRTQFSQCK